MSKEIMVILVGLLIAFAIQSYFNPAKQGSESGAIEPAQPNSYTKAIATRNRPCVVDFSATWCGPCQRYHPIFETVKAKYAQDIDFDEKDIDANEELAQQLGVGNAVPATLFFDNTGKKVGQLTGLVPQPVLEEAVQKLSHKS